MKKGKIFRLNLILIASIFLNLAFISGFAIKKIGASQKQKTSQLQMHHKYAEKDHAGACISHLCQNNPQFNKIFIEHKSYCHHRCNDAHRQTEQGLSKNPVAEVRHFEDGVILGAHGAP